MTDHRRLSQGSTSPVTSPGLSASEGEKDGNRDLQELRVQ
jgi:hypothetical protein